MFTGFYHRLVDSTTSEDMACTNEPRPLIPINYQRSIGEVLIYIGNATAPFLNISTAYGWPSTSYSLPRFGVITRGYTVAEQEY